LSAPEAVSLTPRGGRRRRCAWQGGLSHNKVVVPEGAAGSPPF